MKSEPSVFSIDSLAKKGTSGWDGVRNYQARNFMKSMACGDLVFFYHSNAKPSGVAGLARVVKTAYPDPTQFDPEDGHYDQKARLDKPIWFHVDISFVKKFERLLSIDELRAVPALSGMILFSRSRLSVQPVTMTQFKTIVNLANGG